MRPNSAVQPEPVATQSREDRASDDNAESYFYSSKKRRGSGGSPHIPPIKLPSFTGKEKKKKTVRLADPVDDWST